MLLRGAMLTDQPPWKQSQLVAEERGWHVEFGSSRHIGRADWNQLQPDMQPHCLQAHKMLFN